jgi:hypothetical protein
MTDYRHTDQSFAHRQLRAIEQARRVRAVMGPQLQGEPGTWHIAVWKGAPMRDIPPVLGIGPGSTEDDRARDARLWEAMGPVQYHACASFDCGCSCTGYVHPIAGTLYLIFHGPCYQHRQELARHIDEEGRRGFDRLVSVLAAVPVPDPPPAPPHLHVVPKER